MLANETRAKLKSVSVIFGRCGSAGAQTSPRIPGFNVTEMINAAHPPP